MLKRIALGTVGFLLLVSPLSTSAQSIADLQAQIQALLARIAALQVQEIRTPVLPQPNVQPYGDDYPTPTIGNACPKLSVTLQRGSRDATTRNQVSELQIFLANRLNLNDEDVVTGYFGATTERYLKQFQTDQGLPSYGIAGSLTRAAIASICGGSVPLPSPQCNNYPRPTCGPDQRLEETNPDPRGCPTVAQCVPISSRKCGVNSFEVINRCAEGSSQYAKVQCHDGYTESLGAANGSSCKPSDTWRQYADAVCANRCAPSSSVDLKVAGLDGPITVQRNTIASVSWKTSGMSHCSLRGQRGTHSIEKGLESGTISARIDTDTVFSLKCQPTNESATAVSDNVQVYTQDPTYGPTCTFSPSNRASTDDITDANSLSSNSSCIQSCKIVRNEKYGLQTGGLCVFVGSVGAVPQYTTIEQGTPFPQNSITVTAPNGGEQWEIGTMNTITWTPYGYNPDINPSRDVTAYLLKNVVYHEGSGPTYSNIGKIVPSGKASIHWEGQIQVNDEGTTVFPEPGQYSIMLVNNKTGVNDISNSPFTLLPKSVDLKLNGSDGPITVDTNQLVTASWTTTNVARCEMHNAYPDLGRQTQIGAVPTSGTLNMYLHPSFGPTLYCYKNDGKTVYDSVQTNVQASSANVQIISPNGGESFNPTQPLSIKFSHAGISVMSLALYKNDQWKTWIATDMTVTNSGSPTYSTWNAPATFLQGLGESDNAGAIFKVYATGKKADGTGYVDDKSDAPFSFISSPNTGGLSAAVDASTPVNSNVAAGTSNVQVGSFNFTATNTNISITEVKVKVPTSAAPSVGTIILRYIDQGGVARTVAQVPALFSSQPYASATFTGLQLFVPANTTGKIDIYVDVLPISSGATVGAAISVLLDNDEGFRAYDPAGNTYTTLASSDLNSASRVGYGTVIVQAVPKYTPVPPPLDSSSTRVQTSTLTPSGRVLGTYDDFRDNSGITMQQSIDAICRLAGKAGAAAPLSYSCAPTGTLTESRHNGAWGYFDQTGNGWCSATGVQWVDCSTSTTVSSGGNASNSSNANLAAAVAAYEQLIGALSTLISLLKR